MAETDISITAQPRSDVQQRAVCGAQGAVMPKVQEQQLSQFLQENLDAVTYAADSGKLKLDGSLDNALAQKKRAFAKTIPGKLKEIGAIPSTENLSTIIIPANASLPNNGTSGVLGQMLVFDKTNSDVAAHVRFGADGCVESISSGEEISGLTAYSRKLNSQLQDKFVVDRLTRSHDKIVSRAKAAPDGIGHCPIGPDASLGQALMKAAGVDKTEHPIISMTQRSNIGFTSIGIIRDTGRMTFAVAAFKNAETGAKKFHLIPMHDYSKEKDTLD